MTSVLAQAAVTDCHRLGGLNIRNLFSHTSGSWKSEIKMPAWMGSGENTSKFTDGHLLLSFDTAGKERVREQTLVSYLTGH